jgi:hypothetical protein
MADDEDHDGHGHHRAAANSPVIQSLGAVPGKAGATFTPAIAGVNLTGVTSIQFIIPDMIFGNGNGKGEGNNRSADGSFTLSHLQVSAGGTQLTLAAAISASAKPGPRPVCVVITPNGACCPSPIPLPWCRRRAASRGSHYRGLS